MKVNKGGNVTKLNSAILIGICFWFCAATAVICPAQFQTIGTFTGKNGSGPEWETLVQGTDGNLYGTTTFGGTHKDGTVFKITPSGKLTSLYSFCSLANCADGMKAFSGVVQGLDGNFYGVTAYGGANNYGTVFKITSEGALTTLHSFASTDGAQPFGQLIQATDGNFYGTTIGGGTTNNGTVFKITSNGALTTLYNFCSLPNCTDGLWPQAGVIQGFDGNFYGTTEGSDSIGGNAFKLTPGGELTTLFTFCSQTSTTCSGASAPYASLVQATNGSFYGTTVLGGADAEGTIFRISPEGVLTVIYTFINDGENGATPESALVEGSDGNLYGTTVSGGLTGSGTLYQLTPSGELTSIYSLYCEPLYCPDNSNPYGGLVQYTSGAFYGTTYEGPGTVYTFGYSLYAFVATRPTSGKVGSQVIILGSPLEDASSVTFNGVSAKFTVVSNTEIKATVPEGASTGSVEVTLPGTEYKSNIPFRVN
jgi:uncharacterized repeat protein (TIGR03803 family)